MKTQIKAAPKGSAKPKKVIAKRKPQSEKLKRKPEEYSLEFLADELRRVNGKVYIAAKAIGMTSKVLYDYINRHPELKEIVDDARSIIVDKAELALESAIGSKQGWAVCFTLKTLGKERGYVERNEITGKDGTPLLNDEADQYERKIAHLVANSSDVKTRQQAIAKIAAFEKVEYGEARIGKFVKE